MDTESILSKLDEITALLELSCRQQQEILSRLDRQNAPASAEPMEIPPEDIPEILSSRNRTLAGPTAPPDGLYMTNLWYHEDVL